MGCEGAKGDGGGVMGEREEEKRRPKKGKKEGKKEVDSLSRGVDVQSSRLGLLGEIAAFCLITR